MLILPGLTRGCVRHLRAALYAPPDKISLGVAVSRRRECWAQQRRCLKSPLFMMGDLATPKPPLVNLKLSQFV